MISKEANAVGLAALAWWRSKRPVVYTDAEHIRNPAVNTNGEDEKRLALAVAAFLKANHT